PQRSTALFPFLLSSRSKQDPHKRIDMIGRLVIPIDRTGPKAPVLQGKQKIRARMIDEVGKCAPVASQLIVIAGGNEDPGFISEDAVLARSNIKLEPGKRFDFELRPAAH